MLGALPPIFAGLSPEEQQEAAQFLSDVEIEPGETIMAEGEDDPTMAFITSGSCEIWRGSVKVGSATAREFVGEVEMFAQCPRVNTVTAVNHVHLQVLAPEAYTLLAESGNSIVHRLERAVIRRLSGRVSKLNAGMVQYANGTPFELHPQGEGLLQRITAPFRRRPKAPDLDAAEVLARSDLFSWAPGHLIQDIAEHFTVERYEPEQVLCRQGGEGDRMYLIASGTVEVVILIGDDRAQSIATLHPGQAFGDNAIVLASPRTASCVTRDAVVALTIERSRFLELYESEDPGASAFRQGIIRNLIGQLLPTMDRYVEVLAGATPPDDGLYKGTPVESVWRD